MIKSNGNFFMDLPVNNYKFSKVKDEVTENSGNFHFSFLFGLFCSHLVLYNFFKLKKIINCNMKTK